MVWPALAEVGGLEAGSVYPQALALSRREPLGHQPQQLLPRTLPSAGSA